MDAIAAIVRMLVAAVLGEASFLESLAGLFFRKGRCPGHLFGLGLLLPHGMVAAFLADQLCMCSTLNNAASVQDKNLFGMGNGGKPMTKYISGSIIRLNGFQALTQ